MASMYYNTSTGYEETVSHVTATNSVRLGDRRYHDGEEYIYCYNAGTATGTTNKGVTPVTGMTNYSFTISSNTDVCNPLLGVIKHADIPASSYGWVMCKGYASLTVVSATTADKLPIALGKDGTFIEAEIEVATAGTSTKAGHAYNANTGAGGTIYAKVCGDQ